MKCVALTVAIVLGVSACGVATGGRTGSDAAKSREKAASLPVRAPSQQPVLLDSVQMMSATTGWALVFVSNPSNSSVLELARTTDGARTWDLVSPPGTRGELVQGQSILDAVSGERAWVSGVTPQHSTVVFGTSDAGRSWWRSGPVPGVAQPVAVDFAGPDQGWLLESLGEAMQQNPVRVYRSPDGGRSWSLVARSARMPGDPPRRSGLPVGCDKTGVAFSSTRVGWITSSCQALRGALLVSRDGGAHWANQQLPIPPSACQQSGCEVAAPQFVGHTTFLQISAYPDAALLLVTTDGGGRWLTLIMPGGAGPYPRVRFFSRSDGIAVSAGSQGSIGRDFYLTSDGGRRWTAVPQGRRFGRSGSSFDFVSPTVGFAWIPGADATGGAPSMYRTADSGRTWTSSVPRAG
jgi:photosystem II stability/assembly factor-like uncharacterized protein